MDRITKNIVRCMALGEHKELVIILFLIELMLGKPTSAFKKLLRPFCFARQCESICAGLVSN